MNKEPSTSLIAGLVNHDPKSQELLYRQLYSYGMSVCLRYTSTREEAVEVLNDSFMKVFTKIGQYDTNQSFRSWFRRILINSSINYYKQQLKHHLSENLDDAMGHVSTKEDGLSRMNYQEMISAIQSLPPVYRAVFNLHVIEGYTHEEIAQQLSISVGTSKSNLSRARANLREILKRNHEKGLARYER